jgi:hypothetical protein
LVASHAAASIRATPARTFVRLKSAWCRFAASFAAVAFGFFMKSPPSACE